MLNGYAGACLLDDFKQACFLGIGHCVDEIYHVLAVFDVASLNVLFDVVMQAVFDVAHAVADDCAVCACFGVRAGLEFLLVLGVVRVIKSVFLYLYFFPVVQAFLVSSVGVHV